MGAKFFQKSRDHFKILRVKRVTWSKFRTESPQTVGIKVQNVVAEAIWRPTIFNIVLVHNFITALLTSASTELQVCIK
jgi:hypothetical protein